MTCWRLWNCFINFAVEHWFGCRATEPDYTGDICVIEIWLIDLWLSMYKMRSILWYKKRLSSFKIATSLGHQGPWFPLWLPSIARHRVARFLNTPFHIISMLMILWQCVGLVHCITVDCGFISPVWAPKQANTALSVDRDVNGGSVGRNWLRRWFQTLNLSFIFFKKMSWCKTSLSSNELPSDEWVLLWHHCSGL